jgi:hypothetical protein
MKTDEIDGESGVIFVVHVHDEFTSKCLNNGHAYAPMHVISSCMDGCPLLGLV